MAVLDFSEFSEPVDEKLGGGGAPADMPTAPAPGHLMGFDTPLSPQEEQSFQSWKQQYAPNDSGYDYDLRGAFKSDLKPDQKSGHWPDTYKKPNHPTFSDQSIYAKVRPDLAGTWDGDNYVPPQKPSPSFPDIIRDAGERSSTDAVSPRGARGSMQVLPKTVIDPGYGVSPAKDNSPEETERVGREYASALLDQYKDPVLAAAAYNAGPGRVNSWLQNIGDPRKGEVSHAAFMQRIPYKETRDYVQRVAAQYQPGGQSPALDFSSQSVPLDFSSQSSPAPDFSAQSVPASGADVSHETNPQLTGVVGMMDRALAPYFPKRSPGMPDLASAAVAGIVQAGKELQQSQSMDPRVIQETNPAAAPIDWTHGYNFEDFASKLAYGLGKSAPTLTGGIIGGATAEAVAPQFTPLSGLAGGALGSGIATVAQRIGPAYADELTRTPNDKDGAFNRAWQKTGIEATGSAAGWAAFGVSPFKDVIKHLLFQGVIMQPAVAGATQEIQNVASGAPAEEGVAQTVAQSIAQTPLLFGAHAAARGIGRAYNATRGAASSEGGERGASPGGEQEPPPGPGGSSGPEGPAGLSPGSVYGFQSRPGAPPDRVTILGTFANGKFTTIQNQDGSQTDVKTDELVGKLTEAPPSAEDTEPSSLPGEPVSEAERFDIEPPYKQTKAKGPPLGDLEIAATEAPERYAAQQQEQEAELPGFEQTLAEVQGALSQPKKDKNIFDVVRDLGGIQLKGRSGEDTESGEISNAISSVRIPGLVNNRNGVKPDVLRQYLKERGWFGDAPNAGESLKDLASLLDQQARGHQVLHPKSTIGMDLTARTTIERQMDMAGVIATDTPRVAARKLILWRNEQVAPGGSQAPTPAEPAQNVPGTSGTPVKINNVDDLRRLERLIATDPTEAQKASGTYAKAHGTIQGLPVTLETAKGAVRQGKKNEHGVPDWENISPSAYGYVKGTEGGDGEQVDVYIGDHVDSPDAFVVDQIDPKTGKFDEHKAVLGARDEDEAARIYDAGFSDGSGPSRRGAITGMAVDTFKDWLNSGKTKEPVSYVEPKRTTPGRIAKEHQEEVEAIESQATKAAFVVNPTFEEAAEKARELGIQVHENSTAADIMANVHEREAIMATEAQADAKANEIENSVVAEMATDLPEVLDGIPFGDELRGEIEAQPSRTERPSEVRPEQEEPAGQKTQGASTGPVPASSLEPSPESTQGTPAGRPVDDNKNPIFKEGERVVIKEGYGYNGRHGTIKTAVGITMQNIFGGGPRSTSYHYTVKTDGGVEVSTSKLEPEIGDPPSFIPDPVYDGRAMDVEMLERSIAYDKRSAENQKDAAIRSRKPENKISRQREADRYAKRAADQQSVLDAWRKKHGTPAKKDENPPSKAPTSTSNPLTVASTPPTSTGTPLAAPSPPPSGIDVRENAAHQGIEVRFKSRPDDETLGRLKSAGFKWSPRQKIWYAKATEKAKSVAYGLKAAEQIHTEASDIAAGIASLKERAMIYQADAKEDVARARGLPLNTYHGLPYEEWQKVWSEFQAEKNGKTEEKSEADKEPGSVPAPALFIEIAGKKWPVSSYKDASEKFRATIEEMGVGASQTPQAIIRDGSGKVHGHVAYNGRVFEGLPGSWTGQTKVLYETRGNETGQPNKSGQIESPVLSAPVRSVQGLKNGEKPEWKEIGINRHGSKLFEDQRGVRSYVTPGGIRHSEPVGMRPTRSGVEFTVDRKAHPEFEVAPTPTEQADIQASEQGARAEVDAGEYQPANMPATTAMLPPEVAALLYRRGDTVDLKPGFSNVTRTKGRTVVDVDPEGKFLTLDGGLRVTEDQIEEITGLAETGPLQPGAEEPTLPTEEGQNGIPGSISQRPAGSQSGSVSGIGPQQTTRPASEGEDQGGLRPSGSTPGVRTQGGGRLPERPSSTETGGGTGYGSDVGNAYPGEGTEPGATGRPPDANVQGTDYRIESGEIEEGRGPKAKALDNIAAIELVKQINAEGRLATREEQSIIAKYVGWGGIKGAFKGSDGKYGKGFEDVGHRLKEILTPEEYATAAKSTQYAHYTAEHVIRSMWGAVEKMGFAGGSVFEPGMGIGHFLGMMPPDIAEGSSYQGVEMDHLTADIAKLLYPKSGVRRADFTQMPLPENSFDLVIGNPPFADTVITADPKYAARRFMLHDYFFAKSLDSVRPGGLLAFVTSAGTMNKQDSSARDYLAARAEFLGGVRLPSSAFKKNAGTEVTTDILFFKKRMEQIPPEDASAEPWVDTVIRDLPDIAGNMGRVAVSKYFSDHPDMVLGQEGRFDKLHPGRYAVHAPEGADLETSLAEALGKMPKDIYKPIETPTERAEQDYDAPETKDGSFYLQNGRLMQYDGGVGRPVESRGKGVKGGLTADDKQRVVMLIPVRDALRDVYKADLAEKPEDALVARDRLNSAYDAFTQKFGPINKAVLQYRRPTVVQQEVARAEEREGARERGERWLEGDFDATSVLGDIAAQDIEDDSEEGSKSKKITWSQIAKMRAEARAKKIAAGQKFDEGSFLPDEMPDVIIDQRPNIRPFMDDPESYQLRAIEDYNETTGAASKRRVFYENVLTRDSEPDIRSADDGILWSLNQFGKLDLDKIAEKRKQSVGDLITELGDKIYSVPGTRDTYQLADEYLSGDVLDKLETARKYAVTDNKYVRNVKALEAARPAPLPPSEIRMALGMPWMPANYIQEWAIDRLRIGEDVYVRHSDLVGGWAVTVKGQGPEYARWSAPDADAREVLAHALNRTKPRIYTAATRDHPAQFDPVATQAVSDKIDEMTREFAEYSNPPNSSLVGGWILEHPEKMQELADIYNSTMNRTVLRNWDGSYLSTPGIATTWKWRPHQQRVVARIILQGNTYIAHAVGGGKTSEYIGAGMEMRRLGLIKKPMYVVPKSMLAQFTKEFYEQYPTAKIMVADERRFHTGRRRQFMANVAQQDLDAVIITHPSFGKISLGHEFQAELINEEIELITEAMSGLDKRDDRITISKLENKKEKLEQKLKGAFSGRKDNTNTFEQMGVDFLFVDEAHLFRKLDFASRQSIKGIDGSGSQMAFDLYSKIRYLDSKRPGRSVVMGSGTPVTNTMGELYTLSKYMQRDAMKKRGISHFDSWSSAFGIPVTNTEPTPQGTYERVTRFAQFVNAYELYKMVGEVMDIVTPAQLEQYVVRPKLKGGKRELHLAPKTVAYERFQADLVQRVEAIRARRGPPSPGDDILLSVINDGRHAAIDMRFVMQAVDDPNSKINKMLENAFNIWANSRDTKFFDPKTNYKTEIGRGPATQMIFSNLGVNPRGPLNFSGYQWIKNSLIKRGVPRDQIAFIGDYKSYVTRQKLFNDMNEGKVRFLIGSTQKMGVGINAQRRLLAIHNLDPLWYPADDEQRVGRILRQGNWNPEISVHDYATEGTYDEQMWGMMGRKARFIEMFFRGDPELRTMDDVGEASYFEQASAMAASDPRVIKITEMKLELQKMERQQSAFERDQYAMKSKMRDSQWWVDWLGKEIPLLEIDKATAVPTRGDKFAMRVGDKEYTKRSEAAAEFGQEIDRVFPTLDKGDRYVIGELGGFPLILEKTGKENNQFRIGYRRQNRSIVDVPSYAETPMGTIRGLEDLFDSFGKVIDHRDEQLKEHQAILESLRQHVGKTFGKTAEMSELRRSINKLEAAIRPPVALNTVADVDKAIRENLQEYSSGDIDKEEWERKDRALEQRKEKLTKVGGKLSPAEEIVPDEPPPLPERGALTEDEAQVRKDLIDHFSELDKDQRARLANYNWRYFNSIGVDALAGRAKFQVPMPAPTFFSALERTIEASRVSRATPEQWKGTIKNLPGVTKEEKDWLGIEQWLDQQTGPLTKAQILDFIRANNVQVAEVERGKKPPKDVEDQYQSLLDENSRLAREYETSDDRVANARRWDRMDEIQQQLGILEKANEGIPTKFSGQTLPGGENYRELLLTLPEKIGTVGAKFQAREIAGGGAEVYDRDTGHILERALTLRQAVDRATDYNRVNPNAPIADRNFHGSHFAEPNIVAHVRFNDRFVEDSTPETKEAWAKWDKAQAELSDINAKISGMANDASSSDRRTEIQKAIKNNWAIQFTPQEALDLLHGPGNIVAFDQAKARLKKLVEQRDKLIALMPSMPRGKRTLLIEEIQSDWHQKGRKQGYVRHFSPEETKRFSEELAAASAELSDAISNDSNLSFDEANKVREALMGPDPENFLWPDFSDSTALAVDRFLPLQAEYRRRHNMDSGVPDAPFKTTWHELAFKRMLRFAAENGYDQIAWTPGDVQNDRYDLSKHVESIEVVPRTDMVTGEKTHAILLALPGWVRFSLGVDKNGIVDSTGASNREMMGKRLDDIVGKDMADKILKTEGKAKYTGLDLKVGGEGMRGFYDKILPAFANKYAKKWGAKVGETSIRAAKDAGGWDIIGEQGQVIDTVHTFGEMRRWKNDGFEIRGNPSSIKTSKVHSLPITPAMRDSVLGGQPLFARPRVSDGTSVPAPDGWSVADTSPGEEQVVRENVRNLSVTGKPLGNMSPKETALVAEIEKAVASIAPLNRNIVKVMRDLRAGNRPIYGLSYHDGLERLIAVSLESTDPLGTAMHEVLHWLKVMNFIDDKEWAILVAEARGKGWLKKHQIEARYPSSSHTPDEQAEEAIADEFAWRQRSKKHEAKGVVAKLFKRISDLLKRVAAAARRIFGKMSADDIMRDIASGKIGRRSQRGASRGGRPKFQEPDPNEGQLISRMSIWGNKKPVEPVTKVEETKPTTETVGIGADLKRMIDLFGPKMYGQDMPQVTMKELLQNSFDAIKSAHQRGDIPRGEGSVEIRLDTGKRELTIRDNGAGMTPQTVKDAFLTIAGTNKDDLAEAERSGGFGVAKLAFIFGNEGLYMETVRDGVKTIIDTNSKELLNGETKLKTEPSTDKPGTTVRVKFPDKVKDSSGEMKFLHLGYSSGSYPILNQPLLGDVEVTFSMAPHGKKEILPIGRNQPMGDFPKVTTAHFPWGDIDLYLKPTSSYPYHIVLSSGLYQFSSSIVKPGEWQNIPYDIIMNVRPSVEAADTNYPFNNQREDWSKKIDPDIKQIKAFVQRKYLSETAKHIGVTFAKSQTMSPSGEFSDMDLARFLPGAQTFKIEPEITIRNGETYLGGYGTNMAEGIEEDADQFKKFKIPAKHVPADRPIFHSNLNIDVIGRAKEQFGIPPEKSRAFFAEVGGVVLDFRNALASVVGYTVVGGQGRPVGVSLDKGYHGVHILVPFNAFFLNPLGVLVNSPSAISRSWVHTLFHEAIHTDISGHNEDFTKAYAKLEGDFEEAHPGLKNQFEQRMTDIVVRHRDTFNSLRTIFNDKATRNIEENKSGNQQQLGGSNGTPGVPGRAHGIREGQQLAEGVPGPDGAGAGPGGPGGNLGSDYEPSYQAIGEPPEGGEFAEEASEAMAENAGPTGIDDFTRRLLKRAYDPELHKAKRLGWIGRHYIEPRNLARADKRSATFWNAVKAMEHTATSSINAYRSIAKPYLLLSEVERNKVNAVLELDRLADRTREDNGMSIIARNVSNPEAELTSPGDIIELSQKETTALHAVREMFRKQWNDTISATAKKLGWNGSPTSAAIRAHLEQNAATMKKAETRVLQHTADLLQALEDQERKGYVPLMRYGDYYIAVKPKPGEDEESLGGFPEVKRFELVESSPGWEQLFGEVPYFSGKAHRDGVPKSATDRIAELRRKYPSDAYTIEHGYLKRNVSNLKSLNIPAIEKFLMAIQQKDSVLYGPLVDKALDQMYEELKAGFKKKSTTVPGYDKDIGRGIGAHTYWVAHHNADMLHRDNVDRAYQGVENHPVRNVREFWENWKRAEEKGVSIGDRAAQSLNAAGFYYYMAANPSSALVTFDAPFVGFAVLSTGLGIPTTTPAFTSAMDAGLRAIKADTIEGIHLDPIKMGRTDGERAFLTDMVKRGELGRVREIAADFGALASRQAQAFGEYQSAAKRMLDISTSAFMTSNELSRAVIALTAYRLASNPATFRKMTETWQDNELWRDVVRREGATPASMARFMTAEAAFEWGKKNRAEWARHPLGQIFWQFKHYIFRMVSTMKNLMVHMGAAGRAAAATMLAAIWLFAGAQGLFYMQDMEKLYDWVSTQLTGEDPQIRASMYRILDNAGLGKIGADVVMRGPISVLTGADLSNRLGAGDVVSQQSGGVASLTDAVSALGAAPSIFMQAYNGASRRSASGQGWPAVVAQGAPAAIRNPLTALGVYPSEGVKTQTGTQVLKPEQLGAMDIAAKATGFQPVKVSRAYDQMEYERRTRAAQDVRVTRAYDHLANLLSATVEANKRGNKELAAKLGKDMGDFMKANAGLRLDMNTVKQRYLMRQMPNTMAVKRAPLRARKDMMDNPYPPP